MTKLRHDKNNAIDRIRQQTEMAWISKIKTYKHLDMIWSITGQD